MSIKRAQNRAGFRADRGPGRIVDQRVEAIERSQDDIADAIGRHFDREQMIDLMAEYHYQRTQRNHDQAKQVMDRIEQAVYDSVCIEALSSTE